MSILISLALMGCGGFILFCFAHSLVFMAGIFFALFCGLLFLLDQVLDDEKQSRIRRLVNSTSPMASLQPLGHPYPASMPLGHLSRDSFSNIDWKAGQGYKLPQFYEDPGFGKVPSFKHLRREIYEAWLDSAER